MKRAAVKVVTEFRGRQVMGEEGARLRREAAIGVEVTRILASGARADRPIDAPDRESLKRAINAVEARLVEALWTLARLPMGRGPGGPRQHGLDYVQDQAQLFANAVAAGGKWEQPAMRPPRPSARAIDAMHEPLSWITTDFLPRDRCMLVMVAASLKHGDPARNVNWARVVERLPELRTLSVRRLQQRYQDGLRAIMAELAAREGERSSTTVR
jgi:hypothetical protein